MITSPFRQPDDTDDAPMPLEEFWLCKNCWIVHTKEIEICEECDEPKGFMHVIEVRDESPDNKKRFIIGPFGGDYES